MILDDSIRLAIGQTLQSINNYNQQVIKNHNDVVVPLVFFGMHAEKKPGMQVFFFLIKMLSIISQY